MTGYSHGLGARIGVDQLNAFTGLILKKLREEISFFLWMLIWS